MTGKECFTLRDMTKQEAISIFGSSAATAEALGISKQAVSGWPDELSNAISDRVLGAAARHEKRVPPALLGLRRDKQAA